MLLFTHIAEVRVLCTDWTRHASDLSSKFISWKQTSSSAASVISKPCTTSAHSSQHLCWHYQWAQASLKGLLFNHISYVSIRQITSVRVFSHHIDGRQTFGRKALKPSMSSLWPLKSPFTCSMTPSVLILWQKSISTFLDQFRDNAAHLSTTIAK